MLPFNVRQTGNAGSVGILRKSGNVSGCSATNAAVAIGETRQVELLVFGYACKLFRDDEKARKIDQGKHLISWMGDSNLKIDRYDVRGALSELAPYEPPPGGYGNRLDYISAEEQRAEQLCEEERYFYLYNNEEEHILQQEEDLKRLKQESSGATYSNVAFQYDGVNDSAIQLGPNREKYLDSPSTEEAEEVFKLPKDFEVPKSIHLPLTMKQHAIIEKTARFIASQGVQMEILLKTKQSTNVQFEFLSQNSTLHSYYKFIINAIQNKTYPVPEKTEEIILPAVASSTFNTIDPEVKPIITVPIVKYKPSANCAYTQLISKIKGVPLPSVLDKSRNESDSLITNEASVSNFVPVLLEYNGKTFVTAEDDENCSNSNTVSKNNSTVSAQELQSKVEILKNSTALTLAQNYSSDSDSEVQETQTDVGKLIHDLNFPIPAENLKNIIDKTATYVIKNGRQFEETLRTKSEERFNFLVADNEYYSYYMYKVTGDPDAASKEQKTRKAAAVAAALLSKKGLTSGEKPIVPVSFSIKPKDDGSTTALQPALPQEMSDEEDMGQKRLGDITKARTVPEHVQKAIRLVESQLIARNAQIAAVTAATPRLSHRVPNAVRSRFDMEYNQSNHSNSGKALVKSTKAEMERNALYEQQQQNRQKELKKAEEKVKDKLAQIAREKLGGLLSKEKQLQMERKRKAMDFLNQIKDASTSKRSHEGTLETMSSKTGGNTSDDSETSVHSVPITSYGSVDQTDDDDEHSNIYKRAKKLNSHQKSKKVTVTLSDDDDVQIISDSNSVQVQHEKEHCIKALHSSRKRRLRSNGRHDIPSNSTSLSMNILQTVKENSDKRDDFRNSDHTMTKEKKSLRKSHHRKRKSKKHSSSSPNRHRSRSRKRSRSSSRYSRSFSEDSTGCSVSVRRQYHERSKCIPYASSKKHQDKYREK